MDRIVIPDVPATTDESIAEWLASVKEVMQDAADEFVDYVTTDQTEKITAAMNEAARLAVKGEIETMIPAVIYDQVADAVNARVDSTVPAIAQARVDSTLTTQLPIIQAAVLGAVQSQVDDRVDDRVEVLVQLEPADLIVGGKLSWAGGVMTCGPIRTNLGQIAQTLTKTMSIPSTGINHIILRYDGALAINNVAQGSLPSGNQGALVNGEAWWLLGVIDSTGAIWDYTNRPKCYSNDMIKTYPSECLGMKKVGDLWMDKTETDITVFPSSPSIYGSSHVDKFKRLPTINEIIDLKIRDATGTWPTAKFLWTSSLIAESGWITVESSFGTWTDPGCSDKKLRALCFGLQANLRDLENTNISDIDLNGAFNINARSLDAVFTNGAVRWVSE